MRIRCIIAATAVLTLFAGPNARAQGCESIDEIVRQIEANGYEGPFVQGSYIPPASVPAECQAAMADALLAFRVRNESDLGGPAHTQYRHWLYWQEALFAGRAQQYPRAADTTRYAKAEQHNQPDAYFDAYIAFFERDRAAFASARDRLSMVVHARYYPNPYAVGAGDSLLAGTEGLEICWDRPFADANSITCYGEPMTRLIRSHAP